MSFLHISAHVTGVNFLLGNYNCHFSIPNLRYLNLFFNLQVEKSMALWFTKRSLPDPPKISCPLMLLLILNVSTMGQIHLCLLFIPFPTRDNIRRARMFYKNPKSNTSVGDSEISTPSVMDLMLI
jgi:hypothetical protein